MDSKITKNWIIKSERAKGWIVWARASVFVIFSLTFNSCKAWHNGESTVHVTSTQFQNPVASFGHSSQKHSPEISLGARVQQFLQDNVRISAPSGFHADDHRHSGNIPIKHADFARALANCSQEYITWFFNNQIMAGAMTKDQVLCLYRLYSNPCFLAYIKQLPGYDNHILSVYGRLIDITNQRKKVFQEMGLKRA